MPFVQCPSTVGHVSVRSEYVCMCVWKDRNLSLTSHRQLSTYSFEVYLVVLQTPSFHLPDSRAKGGGRGWVVSQVLQPGYGVLVNSSPRPTYLPRWWNDWKIECCRLFLFFLVSRMMLLTLTRNIKVTVQLMSSNWTKCQPCPINADTLLSSKTHTRTIRVWHTKGLEISLTWIFVLKNIHI